MAVKGWAGRFRVKAPRSAKARATEQLLGRYPKLRSGQNMGVAAKVFAFAEGGKLGDAVRLARKYKLFGDYTSKQQVNGFVRSVRGNNWLDALKGR